MKKLLLSFAAMLALSPIAASADEDVLKWSSFSTGSSSTYTTYSYTSSQSGISYSAHVNYSNQNMGINANKSAYIEITDNPNNYTIESVKIEFAATTSKTCQLDVYSNNAVIYEVPATAATSGTITPTVGTKVGSINSKDKTSDTFEINDTYFGIFHSTNTSGSAAQITAITVTYSTGPADTRDPNGLEFSELSATAFIGEEFTAPTLNNPNELTGITYSSTDPTVASVDADGKVTPLTVGETVISATFGGNETYKDGTVKYTLTVKNPMTKATSIAEAMEQTDEFIVNFPMTVGYCSGNNVFVTDGTDWIQIYGANSYKANDVVPAGWNATYTKYKDVTPELIPVGTLPAATETGEITLRELSTVPTVEDVNEVLLLKKVEFTAATPAAKSAFTGSIGSESASFYNNYQIASVAAGLYDVKAVVTVSNSAVSLYPLEYTEFNDPTFVAVPSFSVADGSDVLNGTEIEITATEEAYEIFWRFGEDEFEAYNPEELPTINGVIGTTVTISAYCQNGEYKSETVEATYKIVEPSNDVTFNFNTFEDIDVAPAVTLPATGKGEAVNETTLSKEAVVMTLDKGTATTDNRIWNASGTYTLRFYSGSNFTVTAPATYRIVSITFTSSDFNMSLASGGGSLTNKVWNAPADETNVTSVKFNNTGKTFLNTMEVKLSSLQTGVETVAVDETAPVEYYNLQGMRVANPSNGIYIKRQGKSAVKVMF